MNKTQKYYDNTTFDYPRKNVKFFIENIKVEPGKAIELGCGAGSDTRYLIKKGWNVLAIDREDVEARISKRLNTEELKNFRFQKQKFENIKLEKSNLIVANYSLPFCQKDKFKELWNKIKTSISNKGYFIGNFFGVKDEWNAGNFQIIFFTKEQVLELFTDFEIICFKEIEKDMLTGLGKMKHCHIFNVIAKKK